MKIEEGKRNFDLQKLLKSKVTWVIAGAIAIIFISYNVGYSLAKVPLSEKKVTYDELLNEIEGKEEELQEKKAKVEEQRQKLLGLIEETTKNEAILAEAKDFETNKTKLEDEINSLSDQVNTKKSEIETLNTDIKSKETELASVTGQIKEKEDAPKQLSAGNFIVGTDIPTSRYKAVPVGNSGNFVVYSSYGDLKVNTILGGDYGEKEYVFFAEEGDQIELAAPAKFIPIE
ncbi:hypothetical protein [Metabacillus bambusae]|uniref:Uncharacterized protein n=1 Tax=Metabacillus bambusae TaxID=2795218 RepID=A0ABS3N8D5_9BACI|nr:hypothetical protein [Metabacillus bambusae]MBO1514301.1 hypothetical protein [Metabacillus bambusae]